MIRAIFAFLFLCSRVYGFYDESLERVLTSIADINHPTLEEYLRLQHYLNEQRTFLKIPESSIYYERLDRIRNLKLVGPKGEMPIFEQHSFAIDEHSKNRCILLFASYNERYVEKARRLLDEIEKLGYSGHVLLRLGGFPNTENGGLKICHVPYSFKLAFLMEAKALGFKEVLWLDLAIHPLTNLEMAFSEIKRRGHFFTTVGSLQDNAPTHRPEAAATMGISVDQFADIPHISSSILGMNMDNAQALQFLENWYEETEKVYSSLSWFPEELSLSIITWRLNCKPFSKFGTLVCLEHELHWLPFERPMLQFYLDSLR